MTIDPQLLRTVMRRWASGVTIVASHDGDGVHGMTVSAFAAISLEPPLVLVSLERSTRTHGLVAASAVFSVSMLQADQVELAERFAGRVPDQGARFDGVGHQILPSGCPIIEGSLAYLDCEVVGAHPGGTHTVFIGQVARAAVMDGASPLIYHNRDYRKLSS